MRERNELWKKAWPFALLCLLSASRWVAADQWPQTGSTLRTEAAACAIGAVVMLLFERLRKPRGNDLPLRWKQVAWTAAAGVGLLAMPALGAALYGAAAEPFNRTAAMCFVPLIAAVCAGVRSGSGMRGIGAPLAGVAGALFLFPLVLPVDVAGWTGLLLPPLAVGVTCGWLLDFSMQRATPFLAGGALGLLVIEGLRAVLSQGSATPLSFVPVGLDLVIVLCAVLSLMRIGMERYATRYLVAPVITVVEGMVLLRPGYSLRVCTGLVLMAGAAIVLWRQPSTDLDTQLFATR